MAEWTEERIELLKKLQKEGLSSGLIGARMGITRNAVIGKLARLGAMPKRATKTKRNMNLPIRPTQQQPKGVLTPPKVKQLRQLAAEMKAETEVSPLPALDPGLAPRRVALLELGPRDCRWPIGDPLEPGFGFCGHPRHEGRSYCPEHVARAYTKAPAVARRKKPEPVIVDRAEAA